MCVRIAGRSVMESVDWSARQAQKSSLHRSPFMNFPRFILFSLVCALPAAAAELPPMFSYSAKNLAAARERLAKGDESLQPALKQLRADADRALEMKPVSVMDKTRTPPVSGDKHDYLS